MSEVEEIYNNQELVKVDQDLAEFKSIIKDIAENSNVLALKEHVQHIASSRYVHCLEVSYYTFKICKKLGLDYISAARGAMLHDFYFYNWRNKGVEGQKKFHLLRHPRIALTNAAELFDLNDLEKDAILKHMWPVNPNPPKYIEGYIITLVDKYCATREFFRQFTVRKELKKAYKIQKVKEINEELDKEESSEE